MANQEQLAIITSDVREWNAWRSQNEQAAVDLSYANLNSANLERANLVNANLTRAELAGANLRQADLSGAIVWSADLRSACLDGAIARGASLISVHLSEASLIGADLRRAVLDGANLSGKAKGEGAKLTAANLTQTHFGGANLTEANLSGANLTRAIFFRANLNGADLTGANLSEAEIYYTVFSDTNLTGAMGLGSCVHVGPSAVDHRTLQKSGPLPLVFLRGCGLPEVWIDSLPSVTSPKFYSTFISYSHSDEVFAQRLYSRLQDLGIRCWKDNRDALGGDDIFDAIQDAIEKSDRVLLCCSRASLTSGWVDSEISRTLKKERELMGKHGSRTNVLVPLDLDRFILNGWQSSKADEVKARVILDFVGWNTEPNKFEGEFARLVRTLRLDEAA